MIFTVVTPSIARPMSLSWIEGGLRILCAVTMLLTFPIRSMWNACRWQSKKLEGTHDFTGFIASGTSVEDKIRTITEASLTVDETGQFLTFTFSGNGFLYKQIRNMVGTLLKIGNNRMPVEQIDLILEKKDRQLAGPTAAPNGLYLKEIRYEE